MSVDNDPQNPLDTRLTPEEQRSFLELTRELTADIGERALLDCHLSWDVSPRSNPLEALLSAKLPPGHIANQGDFDPPRH